MSSRSSILFCGTVSGRILHPCGDQSFPAAHFLDTCGSWRAFLARVTNICLHLAGIRCPVLQYGGKKKKIETKKRNWWNSIFSVCPIFSALAVTSVTTELQQSKLVKQTQMNSGQSQNLKTCFSPSSRLSSHILFMDVLLTEPILVHFFKKVSVKEIDF